MSELEKQENYLREVVVNYKGGRRKAPAFKDSKSVVSFLNKTLIDNSREHFIVLYLNHINQVIGFSISAIGTQKSCPVNICDIFQKAVLLGAGSVIVAHNHPSGSTEPSKQDRAATKRISDAGQILDIPLLDHIIFGGKAHFSFNESNLLSVIKIQRA
jgi:DNA repair protein RadC